MPCDGDLKLGEKEPPIAMTNSPSENRNSELQTYFVMLADIDEPLSLFASPLMAEALALREGLSACANLCLERVNVGGMVPWTIETICCRYQVARNSCLSCALLLLLQIFKGFLASFMVIPFGDLGCTYCVSCPVLGHLMFLCLRGFAIRLLE
ncbi:uncharacterized protein G2W53_042063 [Senna tora]|uniref:Uncharacterized protein n=1 Tax=Senna tora TaxID=362788 RepID=A0A834SKZ6_9FABA|nr:uncharacterized protein G2W53_042063 [Senna tora]